MIAQFIMRQKKYGDLSIRTLPVKRLKVDCNSDLREYFKIEQSKNWINYISTEIYSLKSNVVNFRSEISSGQSEERTTFFTCEKNRSSNQKLRTIFFHCIG